MTAHEQAPDWRALYKVGGFAALTVVCIIVIQMVIFFVWPPPMDATIQEWFRLFHQNSLRGLLDMDLLMLVDYVLLVPVYLALYAALRRTNPSWMVLGTAVLLLGAAAFFASNTCFEMLALSSKHASAATAQESLIYLAAGQVMLESWEGTAFDVAYVLGGVGALIVSIIMLQSDRFGRATAYAGVALGVTSMIPASAGVVGLAMSLLALIPTVLWLVLASRDLLVLARNG